MSTWNADIETNNVTGLAANRSRKSGRSHLDLELVDTLLELNSQIGLPVYFPIELISASKSCSFRTRNRGPARIEGDDVLLRDLSRFDTLDTDWSVVVRCSACLVTPVSEIVLEPQKLWITLWPETNKEVGPGCCCQE